MTTDVFPAPVLQVALATTPTLEAVQQYASLLQKAARTHAPEEAETCTRLAADLANQWRLGSTVLPTGCQGAIMGPDLASRPLRGSRAGRPAS